MAMPTQAGISNSISDPIIRAVVNDIMRSTPVRKHQVRCNDCNLDFSSQIVLDAHLQGARHAKQIQSKTILASLEDTKVAFSKDKKTNGLKCNVCEVYLNSIQQLQTHLNGNRHKKKMSTGDWTGKEIVSPTNLPRTLTKYVQQSAAKSNLLTCSTCRKSFNSQSQLNVHLGSQKHADRVNNVVSVKKRAYYQHLKQSNISNASKKPLTSNFISGGFANYT